MKNLFKIKTAFLIGIFASLFLVSCQQEENSVSEPNPQNLTKDASLSGLLKRVTCNTTSNDNAIDSTSCFSIKMPYKVVIHDYQNGASLEYERPVINAETLANVSEIIGSFTDSQDSYRIVFPITIVYPDYTEVVVQNQDALNTLKAQCQNTNPEPINCLNVNYPVTIFGYDSNFQLANTYTIHSDIELFSLLFNLTATQFYAINYPISITNSSGVNVTINNNIELAAAINTAITDCNPVVNPCSNPHVLTNGLIIYMPFGNEIRDLVSMDLAINQPNYPPQFVTDRNGHANSAVSFSGNSFDYLTLHETDLNHLKQGDSVTISLWFKMQNTNPGDREYFFRKSFLIATAATDGLALGVYDLNTPMFSNNIGAGYSLWDTSWNADSSLHNDTTNWHHVVFTIDGTTNTVKLYRDGVLRNSTQNSDLNITSEFMDYYLGNSFKGYLDDLRVYKKTLNANEVQTLYNLEGDSNTCLN